MGGPDWPRSALFSTSTTRTPSEARVATFCAILWVPAWHDEHHVVTNQISVGFPRKPATVSVLPARVVKVPLGAVVPTEGGTPEAPAEPLAGAGPEPLLATCSATANPASTTTAVALPPRSSRLRLCRCASARRREAPVAGASVPCSPKGSLSVPGPSGRGCAAGRPRRAGPGRSRPSGLDVAAAGGDHAWHFIRRRPHCAAVVDEALRACHLAQPPPAHEGEQQQAGCEELALVDGEEVLQSARRRVQPHPRHPDEGEQRGDDRGAAQKAREQARHERHAARCAARGPGCGDPAHGVGLDAQDEPHGEAEHDRPGEQVGVQVAPVGELEALGVAEGQEQGVEERHDAGGDEEPGGTPGRAQHLGERPWRPQAGKRVRGRAHGRHASCAGAQHAARRRCRRKSPSATARRTAPMLPPTTPRVAALVAARAAKTTGPPQHSTGRTTNKRAAPRPLFSAGACVRGLSSPRARSPARGLAPGGATWGTAITASFALAGPGPWGGAPSALATGDTLLHIRESE